ncbi:MAG: hypothetical protein U0670_03415 [Anaerolineae bacterium]
MSAAANSQPVRAELPSTDEPLVGDASAPPYQLPRIPLLNGLVELALVVIIALIVNQHLLDFNPTLRLMGNEGEYLTNSLLAVQKSLQQGGFVTLWQPYYWRGEPVIDNSFSPLLNPINSVPSLILGPVSGIKISVVLSTVISGLGGWALARVLGLRSVSRLLLAALMIGRGHVIADLTQAFVQLGTSQAYLPWVIAGTVAMYRFPKWRWPLVLGVISFTLMFWAGNIYYVLPTAISVIALMLAFAIKTQRVDGRWQISLDWRVIRKTFLLGVLSIGLSAASFFPIFFNRNSIGGHPNLIWANDQWDIPGVTALYFQYTDLSYFDGMAFPRILGNYYSYSVPLAFVLLLFVFIPPLTRWLHKTAAPGQWRVWLPGAFLIVLFTTWAAGQNPIIQWAYENLPLIGQWRYIGRMLGIGGFWIIVLVAIRFDGLWRTLIVDREWAASRLLRPIGRHAALAFGIVSVIGALLIGAAGVSSADLLRGWMFASLDPLHPYFEDECIAWLRQEYPDDILSVQYNFVATAYAYTENRVRLAHIATEIHPQPLPGTVYHSDLTHLLPRYAYAPNAEARAFWAERGYDQMVMNSPLLIDGDPSPCLMEHSNAFSYAFTVPLDDLPNYENPPDTPERFDTLDPIITLPVEATTAIPTVAQRWDQIMVVVNGDASRSVVVTVQENAYPGWVAVMDGQQVNVESVGGLLGVILPPGEQRHVIVFAYRPPWFYVGGVVTLVTMTLCALYLLSGQFIPLPIRRSRPSKSNN